MPPTWFWGTTAGVISAVFFVTFTVTFRNEFWVFAKNVWGKISSASVPSVSWRWSAVRDVIPFIVFWVLATFWLIEGLVDNPFALGSWKGLGGDPRHLSAMVLALAMLIALSAYSIREVPKISAGLRRATVAAGWAMSISMILALFLYHGVVAWTDDDSVPSPTPVIMEEQHVSATPVVTTVPEPTPATVSARPGLGSVVPSESRVIGGDLAVKVNGRNPRGTLVTVLPPGARVRVTYEEGAISTWDPPTQKARTHPLWGDTGGYAHENEKTGTVWNWISHYRYGDLAHLGVMPQEVLLILGDVGSGQETVIQFRDGEDVMDIENELSTPQALTIYYHGMEWYYLGDTGDYYEKTVPQHYPSIEAASRSNTPPRRVDGWDDQGLDGSVARFRIKAVQ